MQDRVPLYPGRVTLTPVSGQANTYDLTRADQPTQEGTPLNKASLLKDATAALYGLPNTAVPDDVLSKIKPLIDSANANANTKARIATGSYTGTGTYGASNHNSLTFDFEPRFVIISNPYNQNVSSNSNVAILHSFAPVPNEATVSGVGFSMVGSDVALKRLTRSGPEPTITNSKTARWYSADSSAAQLNQSGWVYQYMAIG